MSYKKIVLVGLSSLALALATVFFDGEPALAADSGSSEQYAQQSPDELDTLVAPIALYPDSLLAQVLGAATYPDQVVAANQFVKVNRDLTGDALRAQVENRGWDPAVQALTQFPSVLEQMAKNISWTSALGDAAANQEADVMAAVQRMRARAYSAGTLKSGPEIQVNQQSPQVIVIEPVKPTVVYVPSYNPTVVYGAPVVIPAYSSDAAAAAMITFGVGVAIAAAAGGSCGFGVTWGMGWSTSSIYCGGARYHGNPYWYGGYYPGFYPGYRPPYYYPPPRPPYPPGGRPPGGGPPRPTHPIERPGGPGAGRPGGPGIPPSVGGGSRPGGPSQLPATGGGMRPSSPSQRPSTGVRARPAGPGNLPATGGGTRPSGPGQLPSGGGGARPSGPSQMPNNRATRGYGPSVQPARPNAFSGTGGGRPQSARGNASMGGGGMPAGGGGRRG
jgi:hypothetical protein